MCIFPTSTHKLKHSLKYADIFSSECFGLLSELHLLLLHFLLTGMLKKNLLNKREKSQIHTQTWTIFKVE